MRYRHRHTHQVYDWASTPEGDKVKVRSADSGRGYWIKAVDLEEFPQSDEVTFISPPPVEAVAVPQQTWPQVHPYQRHLSYNAGQALRELTDLAIENADDESDYDTVTGHLRAAASLLLDELRLLGRPTKET